MGIRWGNTGLGTECARDFCAGFGPLQLGVVLMFGLFVENFQLTSLDKTIEKLAALWFVGMYTTRAFRSRLKLATSGSCKRALVLTGLRSVGVSSEHGYFFVGMYPDASLCKL